VTSPTISSGLGCVVDAGPSTVEFPPGATFGPRRLDDFELVWVLSGSASCTIHLPVEEPDKEPDDESGERRRFELRPGMLLLSRPGMTDTYRWRDDGPSRHAYVHFSLNPPSLDERRLTGSAQAWPLLRTLTADDPLEALCRYLTWLPSAPEQSREDAVAATVALVVQLFVDGPLPQARPGPRQHVAGIGAWLGARWQQRGVGPVPVAELAAGVGLSAGHLSRICRAEWSIGPAELVEQLRMSRAASLLRRSNLGVAEVARACGYVDPFHFSRRFRRCFGVAPREFRDHTGPGLRQVDDAVLALAARVTGDGSAAPPHPAGLAD